MSLAQLVSTWSKDPSTKVGAVIVDSKRRIVTACYNGLPRDMSDAPEILDDREMKYACTIHAEENAMLLAQRSLEGCTLYVSALPPCGPCAAKILQVGIQRVVAPRIVNPDLRQRWLKSLLAAQKVFENTVVLDFVSDENI